MEKLSEVNIAEIKKFHEGKRVLLDFMEQFDDTDYVLVGNTMDGFYPLVSENHDSKDYVPRRFRFNCGAVHQYIMVDMDKVRYLDELSIGDEVLVFRKNMPQKYRIGRIKIEIRPFVRISSTNEKGSYSIILQDGNTIAFQYENSYAFLSNLKCKDKLFVYEWKKATHLGNVVDEFVEEIG